MDASQWTLFDKIMYGGLGYGSFCLPTDFFKVIIAILFPPLGELVNILEDTVSYKFPYITWKSVKKLCTYETLNTIVYSLLLTTLFYIPGLVYTLTNIVEKERKTHYDKSNEVYGNEDGGNNTIDEIEEGGSYVGDKASELEQPMAEGSNRFKRVSMDVGSNISSGIDSIGGLF